MDFKDKVVLVTGASTGIGAAVAEQLASRGAILSLAARSGAALTKVAARCGPQALVIAADLATDEGCEKVAKKTLEHFGRLNVLINNAGIGARTCIEREVNMDTFDRVFALNVRGVYNLTRLLVPALIASKGNIVNVSSIAGSAVNVGSLPYAMSKAALDHFSNLIALELAPKGVRVNTISPGITISKFVQRLTGYTDTEYEDWLKQSEATIPLGRVCKPEDVARSVAHLASDDAAGAVTGANLTVDGGVRFVGSSNLISQQMK